MCKTDAVFDQAFVINTIQEYSRRQGIFIKKSEAKTLATSFRKKFGRFPNFKELWALSQKIIVQKTGRKKVSLEEKVDKKLEEMKRKEREKEERRKRLEMQRAGIQKVEELKDYKVEQIEEKVERVKTPEIIEEIVDSKKKCGHCGQLNPTDSKFCLDCGANLEIPIPAKSEEYFCLIHMGRMSGEKYECPNCKSVYCNKCARGLKEKGGKCPDCGSDVLI